MINVNKILLFFLIIVLPFKAYGENKIAYLDLDYLLSKINAGKIILEQLKNNEDIKKENFLNKEQQLKNEENKILASRNIISEKQLDINIKEFQNKLKEYRNFKSKELEKLEKIRNEELLKLLNLVNPIIQEYMKKNSISFLMDKNNIYIADKNFDITNNLIELINKKIK